MARTAQTGAVVSGSVLTWPDEAREVLDERISKQQLFGACDYSLDSVASRRDRVVVAFSWADGEGRHHSLAQALRLKHGKIVDIQDWASPKSALAYMRLRTALG